MRHINWKNVGNKVEEVCKVVGYGVLTVVSIPIAIGFIVGKVCNNITETNSSDNTATSYSDVICTVISKVTFVSDQKEIIDVVKKNETADYYRTVQLIVEDITFPSDIVELIKRLNEK